MNSKILTVSALPQYQNASAKDVIMSLADAFLIVEKSVVFIRKAEHLDIDTPNKDSYELFEAGLDFAMLVTDKQRYLKSQQDVCEYLSIPPEVEWVIQDAEIFPTDIHLTVAHNGTIVTNTGERFSRQPLTSLITWLEQHYA